MAVTFLEPGGDADFLVGTTNGFWGSAATGTIATDFVHGNHLKSIKHIGTDQNRTPLATLADAGSRISFYIYINVLPSATGGIAGLRTSVGFGVASLQITSGGVLQLAQIENGTQIGSNGSTLSTGQWYRISLAYTVTSTTVNSQWQEHTNKHRLL